MVDNPNEAVASLILNQAAIDVADELGAMLANIVKDYDAEVVIGLPTLGLTLAPIVAKGLGFSNSFHHHFQYFSLPEIQYG